MDDKDRFIGGHRAFHLEVNSIEDFEKLCSLIRGVSADDPEIAAIAGKVRAEREALTATVARDTPAT